MRFAPTLAAAALAAAGLTFIPSGADAVMAPEPAALTDAINWLSSWSDEDGLLPGYGGEPSISATADAAKSLDEIGSEGASEVAGYVATAAAAKLTDPYRASQEIAQGVWASDLAGTLNQTLASDLTAHVSDGTGTVKVVTGYGPAPDYDEITETKTVNAAADGRLLDPKFSAWTGTNAQAWAVLALAQAESSRTEDALDYLLGQQCADGGFRSKFSAIDAANQTCAADVASTDTDLTFSSPDATATTVILLSELPNPSDAVTDAIVDAVSFLSDEDLQGADGSFSEWYGVSGNSTGLAARALRLTGHSELGAISAGWLRRHQASSYGACATPLEDDRGALLYSDDAYELALDEGLTDAASVGSAVAVTAQSLAALSLLPVTSPAPKVTIAPTTVKPGAKVAVKFTGANAADAVCVAVNGRGTLLAAGTTSATVVAPRGVAQAPVTVQTASGVTSTVKLTVDTAAKLKATAAKTVKRGKKVTVTVKGLWPSETVTVKLGKITLGKAKANAAGKVVVRVKVKKSTVVGKKKLTVTGAFANRSGATTVKVTR